MPYQACLCLWLWIIAFHPIVYDYRFFCIHNYRQARLCNILPFILFSLRLFTGGYHVKTYLRCFITTNTLFIATILFTEFILFFQLKWIIPILVIISTAVIWIFAPIKKHSPPLLWRIIYKKQKASLFFIFFIFFNFYVHLPFHKF